MVEGLAQVPVRCWNRGRLAEARNQKAGRGMLAFQSEAGIEAVWQGVPGHGKSPKTCL